MKKGSSARPTSRKVIRSKREGREQSSQQRLCAERADQDPDQSQPGAFPARRPRYGFSRAAMAVSG
jgi:hypothetical protein